MVKLHNSEEEHFASTKFCENIIGCEKKKKKKKSRVERGRRGQARTSPLTGRHGGWVRTAISLTVTP